MNSDDIYEDALQAAKTRVLTIHGTRYLQAILPEIVALSREYERSPESGWHKANQRRFMEIAQSSGSEEVKTRQLDRLAAALWEIRQGDWG